MCDVCVETSELVTVCVMCVCVYVVCCKYGRYKLLQHPECKKKCHT